MADPGFLLFRIIPGVLLLFAILCLVLGVKERRWYNMGLTLLVAAGIVGYVLPSMLQSLGVKTSLAIPQVNYTLSSVVKFLGYEVDTVDVGSSKCWSFPRPGLVTVYGPDVYRVWENLSSICLLFNSSGTYVVAYTSFQDSELLLKDIVVIVSEHSWNWLQEALWNFLLRLATSFVTGNPLFAIFGNSFGVLGLDYLFLTPRFELTGLYSTVLHAVIAVSLTVLAIDAAYIALFESRDPLDFLISFLYDVGMWALGTFFGYQIYNIAASFLNYVVITCFNVPLLISYMYMILGLTLAMLVVITVVDVVVFSTSFTSARLLIYVSLLSLLFAGLFRIVLIQALLSILPLIMALWVLPYTRKIADTLLTTLAWATLGGVVNAAIVTALLHVLTAKIALLIIATVLPIIQLGLLATLLTIRKEFGTTIRKRL